MKDKEFITSYGLFCTVIVTIVGIGIFSYPRDLAGVVGPDAWLESFFMGVISFIILRLIWKVEKANNFMEFTPLVEKNLGKFLGTIILLMVVIAQLIAMSISMRTFVEVIKMFLLEKTPTEFIILITILCGTYLIRGELSSIVKFNEVALWTMFIPLVIILSFLLNRGDYTNVLPILHNPPIEYLRALKFTAFSFGGMEIAFLVLPYMKNNDKSYKVMDKALLYITIFYAIVTILVLSIFSKEQTKVLLWPTITMIKSLDIPGTFIERWDGIVMALWVLFYFTTFTNLYYFSSHILKETFKLGDVKISSVLVVPFIYLIAMYPKNIGELFNANTNIIPMVFLFNLVVVPLLLYFVGKIRGRKEGCN
jgi:spore germination protein